METIQCVCVRESGNVDLGTESGDSGVGVVDVEECQRVWLLVRREEEVVVPGFSKVDIRLSGKGN